MTKLVRTVPPLPTTERGCFTKFTFDAPGERVLYCNNNNVIWRSFAPLLDGQGKDETPEDVFVYKEHARKTTCAAFSPNNNWVLTGDTTGGLRLWGSKGEHILKNEYRLWNGDIKDCSWSGDSTRIFACGDGKENRAFGMIWDTGSKTGEVTGHTKMVNSISFRSQRPFRIVTGSEDMTVCFHQGPPFKFLKTETNHSNFVNWVGFSPDGEWAASAASDSKLIIYDGKEGALVKEMEKPAGLTGTLWGAAWSPDSKFIATAGGDKHLRIWDREAGKQVGVAKVGAAALEDMQVGVCWPKESTVVTLCLDGRFLCWSIAADGAPSLVSTIDGTQSSLNCVGYDPNSKAIVAGGSDGTFTVTPPGQSAKKTKLGKTIQHIVCHSNKVTTGDAWVIALDNKVRHVGMAEGTWASVLGETDIKEFASGAGWANEAETKILVGSSKGAIHCVSEKGLEWSKAGLTVRSPTAFACHSSGRAAFAIDKPDVQINGVASQQYDIQLHKSGDAADAISAAEVLTGHLAEVGCIRFSPSGDFLASGDAEKTVKVWCMKDGNSQLAFEYNGHNARVTSLAWMPNEKVLVSGSLDQNIMVWDVDVAAKSVKLKDALKKDLKNQSCAAAHRGGVSALADCGDDQFVSVGADGFLLVHSIS